ncbi:MAG TPA: DNA-3-methyladenine glycosylase [Methanomicrobiales archaeon]|nr:DNA-3-methyladenine glycosylase [Methanomicrobiales archaeon]
MRGRPAGSRGKGDRGEILLSPVPPFDFGLSAFIFSGGDPQIRSFSGGMFRQVLRIGDGLILATVMGTGSVDRPAVIVRPEPRPARKEGSTEAGGIIRRIFNLDLDISPFAAAVRKDPVMSALARRFRGLKPPRTASVFEALVDSITEQQISLAAAHSMERRIVRTFGDTLSWDGTDYYAYPTPERLARVSIGDLRACGLSGKKAEYILGIAGMIRDGALDLENHHLSEKTGAIIDELTGIRGVGTWTAELTALRGLSRLDAIPADDLGIRRSISAFYSGGSKIDAAEARRIAGGWGAWKGLAAYYLVVAEMQGIGPGDLQVGE